MHVRQRRCLYLVTIVAWAGLIFAGISLALADESPKHLALVITAALLAGVLTMTSIITATAAPIVAGLRVQLTTPSGPCPRCSAGGIRMGRRTTDPVLRLVDPPAGD